MIARPRPASGRAILRSKSPAMLAWIRNARAVVLGMPRRAGVRNRSLILLGGLIRVVPQAVYASITAAVPIISITIRRRRGRVGGVRIAAMMCARPEPAGRRPSAGSRKTAAPAAATTRLTAGKIATAGIIAVRYGPVPVTPLTATRWDPHTMLLMAGQ